MAGKFKNALKTLGDIAEGMSERRIRVDDMTREILRYGYGIDAIEARKIAAILVDHAEVTWK